MQYFIKFSDQIACDSVYLYVTQAEKQLELQLFKLFYNERDIDELQDELSKRNSVMERENKKREKIEDDIRERKKEQGNTARELTRIDQQIKESVSS